MSTLFSKTTLYTILFGLFTSTFSMANPPPSAADRMKAELQLVGVDQFTTANFKPGTVKHLVLFRYRTEVTVEQRRQIREHFLALKTLALRNGSPYLVSVEAGMQNSGEGADQNLEDGYIVTFNSEGDRNYYVGQPIINDPAHYDHAHQAFKDFVGPLLDQGGALVFDFTVGN